jgi:hypothetical protein
MTVLGVTPNVEAGFIPSKVIQMSETERDADILQIKKILETKAVRVRLEQLGFTAEEIQERLSKLSDQQIHQIALQLDQLKVGQGDALGIIIAVLVIAILVVVLLKLTGHDIIITK